MLKLREIEKQDVELINKWRKDPETISMLFAPFRYINKEVDERWFENYMANRSNTVRCVILDDDVCVGLISLTAIDHINQKCSLNIMIGEKEKRGKGIGEYAVKQIIDHAFNNLNLHRIELEVLEKNERAIRLYEKVGFVREGMKRNNIFKNGKFENTFFYGLLRGDKK